MLWPWPEVIILRVTAVCGMLIILEQVSHLTHAIPFLPGVGEQAPCRLGCHRPFHSLHTRPHTCLV